MKPFIHDDFLLETETARRLYHEVAEHQPIIDYHCHLPPAEVATNHQFRSLTGIWLDGRNFRIDFVGYGVSDRIFADGFQSP